MDKTEEKTIKKEKPPTSQDLLKIEVATELGLIGKVNENGWKSLTARESGKIGGIMSKKMRKKNTDMQEGRA